MSIKPPLGDSGIETEAHSLSLSLFCAVTTLSLYIYSLLVQSNCVGGHWVDLCTRRLFELILGRHTPAAAIEGRPPSASPLSNHPLSVSASTHHLDVVILIIGARNCVVVVVGVGNNNKTTKIGDLGTREETLKIGLPTYCCFVLHLLYRTFKRSFDFLLFPCCPKDFQLKTHTTLENKNNKNPYQG